MNAYNEKQKIGYIIAQFPDAINILNEYNIKYHSNENRSLNKVLKQQNINESEVLYKFNLLYKSIRLDDYNKYMDWNKASLDEIVDYTINKFHIYLFENLPQINGLLFQTYRLHGAYHQDLEQIYKLYNKLKISLELKYVSEETLHFPAIIAYENKKNDIVKILHVMQEIKKSNLILKNTLKKLRKSTNNYEVPDDGGNVHKTTYLKLQELENEIYMYIFFEKTFLLKNICYLKENKKLAN